MSCSRAGLLVCDQNPAVCWRALVPASRVAIFGVMARRSAIFILFTLAFPASGYSQTILPNAGGPAGFMAYGAFGGSNPSPGGLTLVPGTVVVPGVSGAVNTGTIPLPGTAGAPNIPVMSAPTTTGGMYPPAFYPFVPTTGAGQSTLPRNTGELNVPAIVAPAGSDGIPECFDYISAAGRCGR